MAEPLMRTRSAPVPGPSLTLSLHPSLAIVRGAHPSRPLCHSIKVNAPHVAKKNGEEATDAGTGKGRPVWGSSKGAWPSRPGESAKKGNPPASSAKAQRGRTPSKSSVETTSRTPTSAKARRVRSGVASPSPRALR